MTQPTDLIEQGHLLGVSPKGTGADVDKLNRALDHVEGLTPSGYDGSATTHIASASLVHAAQQHGLRVDVLSEDLQILRSGAAAIGLYQNASSRLTMLDRALTRDQVFTRKVLIARDLPVAAGDTARSVLGALAAFHRISGPAMLKFGHGHPSPSAVTIHSAGELLGVTHRALDRTPEILVERVVRGFNILVTIIDAQAVSATLRIPAHVVGDGRHTVRELITEKNARRSLNPHLQTKPIPSGPSTAIDVDLDSVPPRGRRVFLNLRQKVSRGGDTYEVIDLVHPEILQLAERAAAVVQSSVHTRVRVQLERLDLPPHRQQCVVDKLTVNPGLELPSFPSFGQPMRLAPALATALLESAQQANSPHELASGVLRRTRRRIRPVKDGPATSALISQLGREAASYPGTMVEPRATSARRLDQRCLRQALLRLGCTDVRFRGRFVQTVYDTSDEIQERSGGTLFVRELTRDPAAMRRISQGLGLATVDHVVLGPDDLSEAEKIVSGTPGRWRFRAITEFGEKRPAFHTTSAARLERLWGRIPMSARAVVVDRVPQGVACVLLVVAGEVIATILREPVSIVGDGIQSVDALISNKLADRRAHPFFQFARLRRSLLTETALARRGLERSQVLADGDLRQLARAPEPRLGVETYGLAVDTYPKLARAAQRVVRAIGNPMPLSVTFALFDETDPRIHPAWTMWDLDGDPLLSEFAFPWAGKPASVFEPVAKTLLRQPSYSIAAP